MLDNSGEIIRRSGRIKEQNLHLNKYKTRHKVEQLKIEQLRASALTDPLTKIWNRRALLGDEDTGKIENGNFIPHLTREIAEARKGEKRAKPSMPLTILMFDIDHFKDINDNPSFKHAGGDFVLQSLSKLLNNNIRTADIFGRLGGEEFLIILPETNKMNAIGEAERLRKLVESNQMEFDGRKIKITISVGVAELNDSHKEPKDLINDADTKMIKAKNSGRNQVFPKPNATSLKI